MSEYKTKKMQDFAEKVMEWEQEFAPGSETSMYGDCSREMSRVDVEGHEDADQVIEWWSDYYEYLGEERDAIEDDLITAEESSELWDGDAESSMQRVRDLIFERETARDAEDE